MRRKLLWIAMVVLGICMAACVYWIYGIHDIPTITFPATIDSTKAYPVILVFPAMGADAAFITENMVGEESIIVRFHKPNSTFPTFSAIIHKHEEQVTGVLDQLQSMYKIDTSKIVSCGFSLGGDIAFALALRQTIPITHALIMGSTCTYRLNTLSGNVRTVKFSFLIGDLDVRRQQHTLAADYVRQAGCSVNQSVLPKLSHAPPDGNTIATAMQELLK